MNFLSKYNMKRDREVHGLMKIPSEVVISELRQELGKANSMISELQDKLNSLGGLKDIKAQHLDCLERRIKNLEKDNNKLQEEVKRQQKANTKLMRSIYKLKHNTP
jgi:peptidoglycan hydrolase CwlO-like protein